MPGRFSFLIRIFRRFELLISVLICFFFFSGYVIVCMRLGEMVLAQEDEKSRVLEIETSEDERRRLRSRSLRKKTMNASLKFTQTLRKRGKRVANCRYASIMIEDVRDSEEEEAVNSFREALLLKDLLPPPRFDDYHTMLRLVNCCHILRRQDMKYINKI